MTIANLFARLGFKVDDEKAKSFGKTLGNIQVELAAAATAAVATAIAIKKITDEAFAAATALQQFESETGASAQELQKWQQIAEETNNSAAAVSTSIKAIAANQAKIKLGQGNISGFQLLGIDPQQDPFKILEELRVKTKGLSQSMKKEVLSQVGVSADLIQVLDLTNDQFDEMAANTFIIPKSAIESMSKARGSIQKVGQAVDWLKSMIAAELAPGIIKLNKQITKWIKNNKQGIVKTLKEIFKWITSFTSAVFNAIKLITKIIDSTIGWKNAFLILIGVIALLNSSLLLSPIGLIIAGIVLLVAVLDDLYVYSQGKGNSLFGNLMKQFPELEKTLGDFFKIVKDSLTLIKSLFKGDDTGIEKMVEKLGGLGVGIVALFKLIQTTFQWAWTSIKLFIKPIQFLVDALSELFKAFTGEQKFGESFKNIQKAFKQRGTEGLGDLLKFGTQAKENIKTVQNAFNINMEVNTNADAEETARLVEERLTSSYNSASTQRSRNE